MARGVFSVNDHMVAVAWLSRSRFHIIAGVVLYI